MKIDKDSYLPMSEDFRRHIKRCVTTAAKERKKPVYFSFKRTAVALAALLVIIPLGILGVSKTVEYFSKMEKTAEFAYQPNFKKQNETGEALSSPEFVKLHFTPDEKYKLADTKTKDVYLFAGGLIENDGDVAFSLFLTRPTDGKIRSVSSAEAYHSIAVNGNEGFLVDAAGAVKSIRAFVFFEDVNVVVGGYFNPKMSEAEILSIFGSMEVTKGTKDDHTPYGVYDPSQPDYFPAENTLPSGERYLNSVLTTEGEKMNIATANVFATVNKIYVETNVGNKAKDDFMIGDRSREIQIDENGNVLPRTDERWSYEKGKVAGYDYLPTYLGEVKHERVLVFAEITYQNVTDKEQQFPLDHNLCLFSRSEEDKAYYSEVNQEEKYFSAELNAPVYIENAEPWDPQTDPNEKQPPQCFNVGLLQPGETRTITVGWACDAELLDQAYLSFSQHYFGGINYLPYYNVKVVK